jgi:hypothetical protein
MAVGIKRRMNEQLNGKVSEWLGHNEQLIVRQNQLRGQLKIWDKGKCPDNKATKVIRKWSTHQLPTKLDVLDHQIGIPFFIALLLIHYQVCLECLLEFLLEFLC